MSKRRDSFADSVVDCLARGWLMGRDRDRHWGVYEQQTNEFYSVLPPTQRNARREARLAGPGHRVMPYLVAREVMNAYNHGRHAALREVR